VCVKTSTDIACIEIFMASSQLTALNGAPILAARGLARLPPR
jgi:hypothetical protein